MLKRTAIIELARDRIAVIVPSATAPSSACTIVPPQTIANAWNNGLASLDEQLHDLITEAGVRGGTARLVYTSPDANATLLSLPAGTKHADRAARLALTESCGYPIPEVFAPAVPLVADRPSDHRQCHWLLSIDRAEHLEAAAAWLTRAGVRPEAILPLEATALARVVSEAIHLDATKPGGLAIALRIGRTCSAIAGVHNGRLLFARPLSISVGSIIDALTAPIYPTNHNADPDTSLQPTIIARETATIIAYEAGFSAKERPIPAAPSLTPRDLRPTLQPILQRLIVETRQTLRFGMPTNAAELGQPRLIVSGAGVAVKDLVASIGTMLDIQTIPHPNHERFRNNEATSPGSLLESIRLRDLPKINLLTGEAAQRIARRRTGITAAAGLTIATIVGAADFIATNKAAEALERSAASYTPVVAQADDIAARREQLAEGIAGVTHAQKRINTTLSPQLPVAAIVRDIAARLPERVRLLEINLTEAHPQPIATLRVIVLSDHNTSPDAGTTQPGISAIAGIFEDSPLVQSVRVGNIAPTNNDPHASLQMDITLELVSLPAFPLLAGVDDDTSTQDPR